jgi:hypothetical protein
MQSTSTQANLPQDFHISTHYYHVLHLRKTYIFFSASLCVFVQSQKPLRDLNYIQESTACMNSNQIREDEDNGSGSGANE